MPDIPSLALRVQELMRSVDRWNGWMLAALAIVALFTVGAFVATRMVVYRGKQLASAQNELAMAKERELRAELSSAAQMLEDERRARVEIEDRVSWRRLTKEQRSTIAEKLRPFSNQTATLWFNVGDHEGALFASDLAVTLREAGWNVFSPASKLDVAEGGRRVETIIETGVIVMSTTDDPSRKASEATVKALLAFGFDAKIPNRELLPKRPEPVVIVTVEARPEGPQGAAKLRHEHETNGGR